MMRLQIGSQWSSHRTGVMWSNFLASVVRLAAAFWTASCCTILTRFSCHKLITNNIEQWREWTTLSHNCSNHIYFWKSLSIHYKSRLVDVQFFNQFSVSPVDLGVDPNKSTPVDLGIRSRVGSILLGAVDPPSNLTWQVTLVLLCCKSTWTDLRV